MMFSTGSVRCRAASFLLIGLAAATIAGCDDKKKEAGAKPADPVPVFETASTRKSLVEPVTGTGTIAAAKITVLGPRVTGIIDKIYVLVGARVKEGDPLFHTRDVEIRNHVAELENQVKLADAEVRQASRAYARAADLHKSGFVSNGGLDNAQAARDSANARLGIAKAQLASARQMLEDCTVRAPFDGVITRRDVDEGKYMSTIGGMGKSFDSEVYILNDLIDANTRGIEVRLPIRNPDYEIKPGLFARAELYPEPRKVLSLARSALLGTESQHYVFMTANGLARRVPVETKQIDATTVEVLSGLKEGDAALSGPNLPLIAEGTPVRIEAMPAATASEASTETR